MDGRNSRLNPARPARFSRQWLVEVHANPHATRLGGDFQVIVHLVSRKRQVSAETIVFLVRVTALELRDEVPLLRRGHEANIAVGCDALSMENHLHGGVLLVDEDRVERVVVEHHVEALRTQVVVVRYLHREIGAEGG